ncbi:MAG: ChaN family lipoprotein [Desulfobacterales bacterium]|nr:MAG: ChaN family lipoprotein [Desulfobacterales bacterium]
MAPPKKLTVEDLAASFEEETIISAKLGKPVTFDELISDLNSCRITYVGEKHTDIDQHRHQLEIIQALFRENPHLAVGMEMFDFTYQDVLDQWSAGQLDQRTFLRKVHWYANWGANRGPDFSLYSDILEFIKENHIRLVGLNIPDFIPDRIREGGIENLRDEEKKYLPKEIDTTNSVQREYLREVFNYHHHIKDRVDFEDFYTAQVVWEETMAETIARNLNGNAMVVLAGNGHIQFKYGIPDRAFKRTGVAFRTVYQAPGGTEVKRDIADYIWVTP